MRRFFYKLKNVLCNRISLLLAGLIVSIAILILVIGGKPYMFFNGGVLFWQLTVLVFVMCVTGIGKDFLNGLRLVFSKQRNVSRMELQKAANAMEFAGKIVVIEGVFISAVSAIPILYSMEGEFLSRLGPWLATVLLSIAYSALLMIVMMPLRVRLEAMVISFMVEPDKEERPVSDEQTVYFKLRALGLTDREAEVARLVCCGLANKEIGEMLYISDTTVKKHMTHILEKTVCMNREALMEMMKTL